MGNTLTGPGFNGGETRQLGQRWSENKTQDWNNPEMRRKSGFGFGLSLNQKRWGREAFSLLKRVRLEAESPFCFA